MRRQLLHCLIALTLLLQGVGSAWAASRMAAGDVQLGAQVAELPPCHQEAARAEMGQTAKNCCGTASCHCVMGCSALPALSLAASGSVFRPQAVILAEAAQPVLQAGHYGSALRPPAALQT